MDDRQRTMEGKIAEGPRIDDYPGSQRPGQAGTRRVVNVVCGRVFRKWWLEAARQFPQDAFEEDAISGQWLAAEIFAGVVELDM